MKDHKVNKKDIVWSYCSQIFQFGASIFVLPFVLKKLPSNELGVWYIFTSITALVNLLDFGFKSTFTRNVAYVFAGVDKLTEEGLDDVNVLKKINFTLLSNLLATVKKVYRTVSVIAMFFILVIGLPYFLSLVKAEPSKNTMLVAWFIYMLSAIMNLYYYYYTPLLLGRGLIVASHKTIVFSKIVYILFSFIGLTLGFGLIALGVSNLIGSLVNRILSHKYFYDDSIKKELYKVRHFNKKNLFKTLWPNAYKMGLAALGGYLIANANVLICAKFLSLQEIAEYGISLQVIGLLVTCSSVFSNTYSPMICALKVKGQIREIKKVVGVSFIVGVITYFLGAIVIVLFGNKVLVLMGSNTLLLNRYYIIFLLVILFLEYNQSLFASLLVLNNKVPFVKPVIISGALVVLLSFLLLRFTSYGLFGVLLIRFIIQLCYNNWKWPYMFFKELGSNYFEISSMGLKQILNKTRLSYEKS